LEWKEQQEQQAKQQSEQERFVKQRRTQTQTESSGSGYVQTMQAVQKSATPGAILDKGMHVE